MVHAILGVRPAVGKEGPGPDSQGRMDPIITVAKQGKESVSPATMNESRHCRDEMSCHRDSAIRPEPRPTIVNKGRRSFHRKRYYEFSMIKPNSLAAHIASCSAGFWRCACPVN